MSTRCNTPFIKDGIPLPCGKCGECKSRRVSGWSFRLLKEAELSSSALFVTLTYDNSTIKLSTNGFPTLWKPDIQNFMKRLRKLQKFGVKLKYYACGEYGGHTQRPHYHIILFNADQHTIQEAWSLDGKPIGTIHIGQLTAASTQYTLKYINKGKTVPRHERDDREPEFSLMSKSMGANYLTPQQQRWHKSDLLNRMYVPLQDGKKIAMPRYYKDKLYSRMQKKLIQVHVEKQQELINNQKDLSTKLSEMEQENLIRIAKWHKRNKDDRNTTI